MVGNSQEINTQQENDRSGYTNLHHNQHEPTVDLATARLGEVPVSSALERTFTEYPNVQLIQHPHEIQAALANPNTNAVALPLPACTYTELREHLQAMYRIQTEQGAAFSYSPASPGHFDAALTRYISMLDEAGIPKAPLERLRQDIEEHRSRAIAVLGDENPAAQILIKGLDDSTPQGLEPRFDPWHVDWDQSQVYIWTPVSDYNHATEGTADTNVNRSVLWQAWQHDGGDLLGEPGNFMYDPKLVLEVPNNTLIVFLGEIPAAHQEQFTQQLGDHTSFNENKAFVHRSTGMEPGKWRLAVRFFSHVVPEHLENKLD